jgi:hypothetical protein
LPWQNAILSHPSDNPAARTDTPPIHYTPSNLSVQGGRVKSLLPGLHSLPDSVMPDTLLLDPKL